VAQENREQSSIAQVSARQKATDELEGVPEEVARDDSVVMRQRLTSTVSGTDSQLNLADLQLLPSDGRAFHLWVGCLVVVQEFGAPHLPG
jgi:hypothetical protein